MPRFPVVNLGQAEVPFSKVERARRERREQAAEARNACSHARDLEAQAGDWKARYEGSGILFKDQELLGLWRETAGKAKAERDRCRKISERVAELDRWLSGVVPSVMLDLPPRAPYVPVGPPIATVDPRFRPARAPVPLPAPSPAPVPTVEEEGRAPRYRPRIPTLPFGNLFTGGGMGPVTYTGG